MNRTELAQRVAEDLGMTQAEGTKAVNAVLFHIANATLNERALGARIIGFGRFTAKKRPARRGRNPRTGEPIKIPARVGITFSPAKALKDRLNQRNGDHL